MAVIPESLSLGELSHLEDLGIIDTILNVAVTGVSIAKEIEAIRASREATKTQDRLAKMQISIEQQRAAQEAIVKEAEAESIRILAAAKAKAIEEGVAPGNGAPVRKNGLGTTTILLIGGGILVVGGLAAFLLLRK